MRFQDYIRPKGRRGLSGLIFARGSFGILDGDVEFVHTQQDEKDVYCYANDTVALRSEFTREVHGAVIRRDYLENLTDQPVEVNSLLSRFFLDGNDYQVYTQQNGWQNESDGSWQPLAARACVASQGMRSCEGATPMMALHNVYSGRNLVFHLIPNAQWQITARKIPWTSKDLVVLEMGLHEAGLRLQVQPGETISLPAILFFRAENRVDLDAYKLHEVYNKMYPRREMPAMFNSWLYCYEYLNVDDLLRQVDAAAELGFEGFMLDAGWYGSGRDWSHEVGDWFENPVSGPAGRMIEVSQRAREKGMRFGLWIEPERAGKWSKSLAEHPEYYFENTFLDFANPEARTYMLDILSEQIEKYQIGWVKFDCNCVSYNDPTGSAFYRYVAGQKAFMQELRRRHPDLYITNCAAGGFRLDMEQGSFSDSFWPTDNQGPLGGLTILKNTLLRLPTCLFERWNVQKYCDNGFLKVGQPEPVGLMFSCNNASWDYVVNVDDSFTEAFITSGPLGFSCEVADIPEEYRAKWKAMIARYKENRPFYMNAAARILVDTDSITAIQYSDYELNRCVVQVFTKVTRAEDLILYPVVDGNCRYRVGEQVLSGEELMEDGLHIKGLKLNSCVVIELTKEP